MRLKLTLLTILCLSALSGVAQSRLVQASIKSDTLGVDKPYVVYLPDGYEGATQRYPVLYLLHGAYGMCENWADPKFGNAKNIADSLISVDGVEPLIIIMPGARGQKEYFAVKNMGYFNVEGWNYQNFFFAEFIQKVERTLRIKSGRENRYISGLSMGGGGSVIYAQSHPELFAGCYSMSGLLGHFPRRSISRSYTPEFLWSVTKNSAVDNLKLATPEELEAWRGVRWFVDCGDDDYLHEGNMEFYRLMREKEIKLEYRMRDGGHTWQYWREAVPIALEYFFGR